jgi:hypothetical protein
MHPHSTFIDLIQYMVRFRFILSSILLPKNNPTLVALALLLQHQYNALEAHQISSLRDADSSDTHVNIFVYKDQMNQRYVSS